MDLTAFPKNLSRIVFESGMTHRHIAKEVGISECTFSRIIHGVRLPTLPQFVKLAEVLNVKMEDFVDKK